MQVVQLIQPAPAAVPPARPAIVPRTRARPTELALFDRTRPLSRRIQDKGQKGRRAEAREASLEADLVSAIPRLRAFAMSLVHKSDRADDLVQQTLMRALQNIRQFTRGTNMVAWLITILRNEFYSEQIRRYREIEDADGTYAQTLVAPAEQLSRPDCWALSDALDRLPREMSEPLLL